MNEKTVLSVKGLRKDYGQGGYVTHALNGIDLVIPEGDFLAIMGPSGSGKSTLLNIVATIDKKTAGSVAIVGRDIDKLSQKELSRFRREKLGFVFQDYGLLYTLNGFENIALTLSINGADSRSIEEKIKAIAALLAIAPILDKYPYEMSGGEKQRVAIARAVVTSPALLLADEPTGALDRRSGQTVLESFDRLNQEEKVSVLMVTHDPFAASYAKRIVFLADGKLTQTLCREGMAHQEFYERIISEMGKEGAQR